MYARIKGLFAEWSERALGYANPFRTSRRTVRFRLESSLGKRIEQCTGKRMQRIIEKTPGIRRLDDLPCQENANFPGVLLGEPEIVRYDQNGF